ncbi:DNRLRE domain-containing protein [Bryocella elongata]|uniref:DNRLRE domain-containing protein n=1 Tax=Bryocella elongata TaxID=863522 RepID=UPI001356C791|nr:DNRLRE domain-containing protein [Bryocella elongata]
MQTRLWRGVVAFALAVLPACLQSQQATLVGDAHVSSAQPGVNAGSLSNLNVGGGYTALVQFDLGVLPPGTTASQITRATLKLYLNRADTAGAISVAPLLGAWSESTVNYGTLPNAGSVVQTAQAATPGQFVTFDVTGTVQQWLSSPSSNYGVALTSSTAMVQFDSKENDETSHEPQLVIALATGGSAAVGATGATGATGAAGATGATGATGPQGLTGLAGSAGIAGTTGATGPAGQVGATGATGAQGIAGITGTAGAAGPMGVAGATGAVGPQGATGATGATGAAGADGAAGTKLTYQGTYDSTINYALGDVVTWQGSSYLSLTAANHGNTPSLPTGSWGLMAVGGATGATGAVGPAGPAGASGVNGLQGVTGATGAMGVAGATGAPGLIYQGAYDSGANYDLGDVVVWQGASYASLTASNHGQTPGVNPAAWGLLAAQGGVGVAGPSGATGATGAMGPAGAQGPVGPLGAQGVQGPQGPAGAQGLTGATGAVGPQGVQGLQGVAGTAGAQGVPGVMGATGVVGPTGATGAAGPVGLNFRGAYDSTINYGANDGVLWQGAGWVSQHDSNHGNTPGTTVGDWTMFAAAGATGAIGPQGEIGLSGATGATGAAGSNGLSGATGATGVAGSPGLVYQGAYDSTVNYNLGDVVQWQGASWASLGGSNHGQTPGVNPAAWGMLAAQGGTGPAGATGPQGVVGPVGPAGATGAAGLQGVTGPQGSTGATGSVGPAGAVGAAGPAGPVGATGPQGLAGTAGAQGVPGVMGAVGPQGPVGATGAAGPAGMSFRGSYNSATNYAQGDGVLWQSAGWVSLVNSNVGNTPGQSPADWVMFAAGGATGATGAAGLAYQGAYDSTLNYNVGDVVVWQGASYASLTASNHGQTPGVNPAAWGLLAAQGGAGPAGATGPQGSVGSTGLQGLLGPAGPQGAQGVQGPEGPAGAQGLTGATGAVGANGATGPQGLAGTAGVQGVPGITGATGPAGSQGAVGPAGPVGLSFRGAYDSTVNYALGDGVQWQGAGWVSIADSNQGNRPDLSPAAWSMFAAAGASGATGAAGTAGSTGPQGPAGAIGPVGATGATGATGSAGVPGLVYRGAYDSTANYASGDVVVWNGSSYASLAASNVGLAPDVNPGAWGLLSAQGAVGATGSPGPQGVAGVAGATGPAGPQGSQGVQGVPGPQGPVGAQGLSGPSGAVGATGATGPQGLAGTAGAQGVPGVTGSTGPQGAAGATGAAGAVGLNFRGAYDATATYAQGDGVLWQGAGYVSLADSNTGNTPSNSPGNWTLFAAAGATGSPGAIGLQGSTGATGAQGTTGPAGVAGATGATGATGSAGVNFAGGYSPTTSYNFGDAVVYGGSSYVSLATGNVGQNPASSASWGILAAQGATGAAGPQGPTGAVGNTGAPGATGATGAQGAPMSFAGGWSTSQAYNVGDAVSYGGSSYIAIASNSGREPDASPAYWSLLAASGAIGPSGAMGPTGLQGPLGYPGATGPQGDAGPQGVAGPIGPAGATGSTGVAGPQGVAGATGAAGINWQGPYVPASVYNVGDAVSYAGSAYLSLVAGNTGQRPDVATTSWAVLASAGANGGQGAIGTTGSTGAAGATGAVGATGATGATGANGVNGTPGLTWRAVWSGATTYSANDAVLYNGSAYLSLSGNNSGNNPASSAANWSLLAAAGTAGTTGAAGAQGATGATGAAGPAGATGPTGATGSTGAAGINFRGGWTSGTFYNVNDAVTYAGSSYLATAAGSNFEPDLYPGFWEVIAQAGGAGPTGPSGAAASVTLGSVTTLAAGSAATVTNSGTAQNAVLNFGIPQGAAGAAGSGGSSSTASGTFAAMYHSVNYLTTYYAVNTPNSSASEGDSVLAWVPNGCTASSLGVYSRQSNNITVTLRLGVPGSMSSTAISCTTSSGQCTGSGSVAIAPGQFIDLQISGASGTAAGVWTSLSCQ